MKTLILSVEDANLIIEINGQEEEKRESEGREKKKHRKWENNEKARGRIVAKALDGQRYPCPA